MSLSEKRENHYNTGRQSKQVREHKNGKNTNVIQEEKVRQGVIKSKNMSGYVMT